jgi:hypothetical protein
MQSDSVGESKSYSPPTLKKLTVEQARQFLATHASCGDQDAIDLLKLLDEEFQERQQFLDSD